MFKFEIMNVQKIPLNDLVCAFLEASSDKATNELISSLGGANFLIDHLSKEIFEIEKQYIESITFRKSMLKKILPFKENE